MILAHTHWVGDRSVPCYRWITSGKLVCDCTTTPMSVRVIGYIPIITKQREKLVVIASATVAQRVESVPMGTPIRFSRPKKAKRPLTVMLLRDLDLGEEDTKRFKHAAMHDINEYLLHLWQDRALNEFFEIEHRPACGAKDLNRDKSGSM